MSLILITLISFLGIVFSKFIFEKWFNHLSIYCVIMGGLIFLYELKLFAFPNIVPMAWFFFASSFLSFFLGILSIKCARNLRLDNQDIPVRSNFTMKIFSDDGKVLKYSILFFSAVALFVAFQRWMVLIDMFGSVPAVLINAGVVYRLNVQQEIKEFIPILPAFVYVAIFLSGIYTAYKGKFTLLIFLPFIAIVLKELTYFGRAELLLTLLEFLFSFFLFRHLLNNENSKRFKFSKKNAFVFIILLFVLITVAASFIRVGRGVRENYPGISNELRNVRENLIVSPSVYLYLSSDAGVFSRYIEQEREQVNFGENTFFIFYVMLSRLDLIEKPEFFPPGYYIPMWSNTGTFLRELHADFGLAGIFIVPYLMGLFMTWLWFKFYQSKSLYAFAVLVYFYLIIGFSFLTLATKLNQWYLSLFLILTCIPAIEKIASRNKNIVTNF